MGFVGPIVDDENLNNFNTGSSNKNIEENFIFDYQRFG